MKLWAKIGAAVLTIPLPFILHSLDRSQSIRPLQPTTNYTLQAQVSAVPELRRLYQTNSVAQMYLNELQESKGSLRDLFAPNMATPLYLAIATPFVTSPISTNLVQQSFTNDLHYFTSHQLFDSQTPSNPNLAERTQSFATNVCNSIADIEYAATGLVHDAITVFDQLSSHHADLVATNKLLVLETATKYNLQTPQ